MNTWQFIHDKVTASIPVFLLYVVESKGSSPGRQGFNMAVSGDDCFAGTIGGGIMEHKFVELAKSKLKENDVEPGLYQQVHDKIAKNQSGMICSGEQTVFLYMVRGSDLPHIEALLQSLSKLENGTLKLRMEGLSFANEVTHKNYSYQPASTGFLFIEKTGFKNQLHIIGGGHCSLALSKLMSETDFQVSVYEDRPGLYTLQQNSFAHKKILLKSYEDLADLIVAGENVYVVIMTVGYRTDDIALKTLAGKRFKYLGMLGSRNKVKKMLNEKQPGLPDLTIEQIHAPIGIAIKSQTAQEIAISIAAEIIMIKNKDQ